MNYDPMQPTVYFDIGEAIAAIGILLAFIAISNPRRRFRWTLGCFRLHTAYTLFFVGILAVIWAALLPVLPFQIAGVAGWPIFWEVTAGGLFVIGSLGLILSGMWPVKLTKRNGKSFFELSYSVIARGDDQDLGALAEEIAASANSVVTLAKGYDQFQARCAKESKKPYDIPEPTRWACSLMDLWSDRRFCNVIVTRCPSSAIMFFRAIKEQGLYDSGGYSFVQQLVGEAFRDPNSILHREERYTGLGHFLPFTETVFGDYRFVQSNFRPLQASGFRHDNLRDVEKYAQCLLRAVRAYLDSGDYHGDSSAIWCGVNILAESGGALVGRMRDGEKAARLQDSPFWALTRVSDTFRDIFKLAREYENKLPVYPFEADEARWHRDESLYGILAEGIYKYFDGLTRVNGHDDDMRMVALDVWMEIYSPSAGPECRAVVEIQKRLEPRFWAQVKKNMEQAHLCYPMITRLLVSIMGLQEHPQASEGEKRIAEHLRNTLKVGFKNAALLSEKRAHELLPEDYVYDSERNAIVVKHRWGGKEFIFQCD